jgi:spermidine synthase
MKAWDLLEAAPTPDGGELTLSQRGTEYMIRINGQELMSNRTHSSESELGRLGCQHIRTKKGARVLIGGLGLGFTLRAALDELSSSAEVVVAEMSPQVEKWNRTTLAHLAGNPLEDKRASVEICNVIRAISSKKPWDAILLDVDNGPSALCTPSNEGLYDMTGLWRMHTNLNPGGVAIVWSSGPDEGFVKLMNQCGFEGSAVRVASHQGKGVRHCLFVGKVKKT